MAGKWDRDLKQIPKKKSTNQVLQFVTQLDPLVVDIIKYHQWVTFFSPSQNSLQRIATKNQIGVKVPLVSQPGKNQLSFEVLSSNYTSISIRLTTTSNYTNRKLFLQKLGELKCHSKTLCGESQLSFPTRFEPWVFR